MFKLIKQVEKHQCLYDLQGVVHIKYRNSSLERDMEGNTFTK